MIALIKSLLTSKKAVMAALGFIASIAVPVLNDRLGWHLSADQIRDTLYPFIAYILGQGIADHGKGVAQVNNKPQVRAPEADAVSASINTNGVI